jgi:hypothetical protein
VTDFYYHQPDLFPKVNEGMHQGAGAVVRLVVEKVTVP